ncbi:hypothetical protein GA0115240_123623 [Streptomyces sp. DvalAA-14]|nr:hypothetical protein GA0115240_123623 [Streptomyces sp. DvalAA-14]
MAASLDGRVMASAGLLSVWVRGGIVLSNAEPAASAARAVVKSTASAAARAARRHSSAALWARLRPRRWRGTVESCDGTQQGLPGCFDVVGTSLRRAIGAEGSGPARSGLDDRPTPSSEFVFVCRALTMVGDIECRPNCQAVGRLRKTAEPVADVRVGRAQRLDASLHGRAGFALLRHHIRTGGGTPPPPKTDRPPCGDHVSVRGQAAVVESHPSDGRRGAGCRLETQRARSTYRRRRGSTCAYEGVVLHFRTCPGELVGKSMTSATTAPRKTWLTWKPSGTCSAAPVGSRFSRNTR